jgi:hypothetical protein
VAALYVSIDLRASESKDRYSLADQISIAFLVSTSLFFRSIMEIVAIAFHRQTNHWPGWRHTAKPSRHQEVDAIATDGNLGSDQTPPARLARVEKRSPVDLTSADLSHVAQVFN